MGPRRSTVFRSRLSATSSKRGSAAERRAAWHYRLRGYVILARNAWAAGYELDLVARRGRRVVFVEVKERGATSWGDALEAVDAEKQRRIRQAAEVWLASRPELRECVKSFEVVAVRARALERIAQAF